MFEISNVKLEETSNSNFVTLKRMSYRQNEVNKKWDIALVHDSVAILLFDNKKDEFIIVKQFRPPVYLKDEIGLTYELCAGILDKNKSEVEIAKDEILEECGYDVDIKDIEKITSFYTAVGFAGAKQTLFFANVDDSKRVNSGGGVDLENIEVIKLPIESVEDFIFDETKPKTPGIMFAMQWFLKEKLEKNFFV